MEFNLKPVIVEVFGPKRYPCRLGNSHRHLNICGVDSSRDWFTTLESFPEGTDLEASDELGIVGVEWADQFHVTLPSYGSNRSNVKVVSPTNGRR